MTRFYNYLKANKGPNVLIVLVYYILVVLPHNVVGIWINGLFEQYSRPTYNLIVLAVATVVSVAILVSLVPRIKKHPSKREVLTYIILSLIFSVLCLNILMVINVEMVHFLQYAILAILIFPLNRSYIGTIIWCTIAGGVDEAYQYLILESNAFYYDFNDVVLDNLGACMGVLVLYIFEVFPAATTQKSLYKRSDFLAIIGLVLFMIVLGMAGQFSLNNIEEAPAFFTLFKSPPPAGFWYYPIGPYARFHILLPIPALIIITCLVLIYGRLGKR